ncbi:hypothetical protein RJ640_020021 [Escallonia rubra]|uniref:Uncharacterized protein n=1 Tax=Escallonia rubra TaxID=112253 RepID=A0AA88UD58_9ASTE|nr:hypothetical protein RJ640_020021 [Escallonia rubra]
MPIFRKDLKIRSCQEDGQVDTQKPPEVISGNLTEGSNLDLLKDAYHQLQSTSPPYSTYTP